MAKKHKNSRTLISPIIVKSGLVFGGIIVLIFLFCLIFNLAYAHVIFPNTYIGNVNLSNKSYDEARATLTKQIDSANQKSLNLKFNDQTKTISPKDIDLKYDLQKNLDLAWSVGRQGNFAWIVKEQIYSLVSSNKKMAVYDINNDKLNKQIAELAAKVDQPEQDAIIMIKDLVPSVTDEKTGFRVNQDQAKTLAQNLISNFLENANIELKTQETLPKVVKTKTDAALKQTQTIMAHSVKIKAKEKDLTLDPKDEVGLLEFKPEQELLSRQWVLTVTLKKDATNKLIDNIATSVDQPAKDAKFAVENGRVTTFQMEQPGYELEKIDALNKITDAVLNQKDQIELSVKTTEPKVTSESIKTNGIKELVAEGVTSWKGSPKNRIHNLTLGANNISGTIVQPGDEFSTVKALGPIDEDHGFLKELVIKNGNQVVPDVGGGLCQVSTTLFRAAMNAGLKITARTNHSFRVSYYEPPVGMDATIYDPKPDFKFINNMSTPILIWATPTDTGLSFQIYGTKDGRKSDISDPVLTDYVSPPDPIYTETDTMATGDIRQVERATRGVTASFHYKVTAKNGDILQDLDFVSKYIPIANTFLMGPGTQIPQ